VTRLTRLTGRRYPLTVALPRGVTPEAEIRKPSPSDSVHVTPAVADVHTKGPSVTEVP
jgi:hypothetical protein